MSALIPIPAGNLRAQHIGRKTRVSFTNGTEVSGVLAGAEHEALQVSDKILGSRDEDVVLGETHTRLTILGLRETLRLRPDSPVYVEEQ